MTPMPAAPPNLLPLAARLVGELLTDDLARTIYSTDASEYRERPLAVAFPKTDADVAELVRFASAHRIGLIPRAAGTSLTGQLVRNGIVVDLGRHKPPSSRARTGPGGITSTTARTSCSSVPAAWARLIRRSPWASQPTDRALKGEVLPVDRTDRAAHGSQGGEALLRFRKQIKQLDLLILDELGYVPTGKVVAELLFYVLSTAYERQSLIMTKNLPFEQWTDVLGSERLAGSTLDRLTHHCHIPEAKNESFRLRDARKEATTRHRSALPCKSLEQPAIRD